MTRAAMLAAVAAAVSPVAVADLVAGARQGRRRGRMVAILAAIGRRVGAPAPPGDLGARLAAAGLADRVRVADAMAVKAGAAAAALLAAVGPATALPGHLGPAALVGAPALGFLAPDLWLRSRARRRARRLTAELPDGLELLRVAVDAGLTPMRALGEVGRRHPGLLGAELRATAARVALGVPPGEALDDLAQRCPLPAVSSLVATLERAGRHGAPPGIALAALAADTRAERTRALRDRAARAAPKIQLVIALLLVPAVLALVAAALASTLV